MATARFREGMVGSLPVGFEHGSQLHRIKLMIVSVKANLNTIYSTNAIFSVMYDLVLVKK
jgi:hypothetical protein